MTCIKKIIIMGLKSSSYSNLETGLNRSCLLRFQWVWISNLHFAVFDHLWVWQLQTWGSSEGRRPNEGDFRIKHKSGFSLHQVTSGFNLKQVKSGFSRHQATSGFNFKQVTSCFNFKPVKSGFNLKKVKSGFKWKLVKSRFNRRQVKSGFNCRNLLSKITQPII